MPSFICPSTPGERLTKIYAGWNLGWTTNVANIPDLVGMSTDYQGVRGLHRLQADSSGNIVRFWDSECGVLNERGVKFGEISDGTSNTILLFEMAGKPIHWHLGQQREVTNAQFYGHGPWAGNNGVGIFNWAQDGSAMGCNTCNRYINVNNQVSPYSFHPGVVMIVLVDGSTTTLSDSIDSELFSNLCRKQDGNVIGAF